MNLELLIVAILLIVLFFKLYLDKTNVLMIVVLLDLSTLAKLAKIPHKGVELSANLLLYGGRKLAVRLAGYSEVNIDNSISNNNTNGTGDCVHGDVLR
jgi:hypothetical protein